MRLQKKEISSDGSGRVSLVPLEANDFWYLFRILDPGNTVKIRTARKVVKEGSNGTTTSAEKKIITIIMKVSRIEYDPQGGSLRVTGQNIGENEFIRLGQFHSADVHLDAPLTIGKSRWDSVDLKHIAESCDASLNADVAAIILDTNAAHLHLVTPNMCIQKSSLQNSSGKKKFSGSMNDAKLLKYFKQIVQSMLVHVNEEKVKAIIVASSGTTNAQFVEYLKESRDNTLGRQTLSKILLCKVGNTTNEALKDIFDDPAVLKRLGDTKFSREIKVLNSFMKKLNNQADMVAYGYATVKAACAQGAIDDLLVSDALTACTGLHRRKVAELIKEVETYRGSVHTLSSMHSSGKQLEKYTGIAAILRFPCPDLEVSDEKLIVEGEVNMKKLSLSSSDEYATSYDGRMLVKGQ